MLKCPTSPAASLSVNLEMPQFHSVWAISAAPASPLQSTASIHSLTMPLFMLWGKGLGEEVSFQETSHDCTAAHPGNAMGGK